MYILIKFIALFWVVAEILIIVYLNWGITLINGKRNGEKSFVISCSALSVLLTLVLFLGEPLLGRFIDFNRGYYLYIYRSGLWNFFCTLWVVLEGIIMMYVLTIYKSMKGILTNNGATNKTISSARFNFYFLNFFILLSFFSLYILYEYTLLSLVINHHLKVDNFQNLSLFYIKICGVFWILFDGGVAFLGCMTYSLLKNSEMDMS